MNELRLRDDILDELAYEPIVDPVADGRIGKWNIEQLTSGCYGLNEACPADDAGQLAVSKRYRR